VLRVTTQARNELYTRLVRARAIAPQPEEQNGDVGFRLRTASDRLDLELDSLREEDDVVAHSGELVLMLEPEVSESLEDCVLDLVITAYGPQLKLRART
jgi:hypothetical protein